MILAVGNECRQRRGSVGSLDSGMSISFQSTTATKQNPDQSAPIYVTSAQVAMAVAASNIQRPMQGAPNAQMMMQVPALLPNSALYQYNNEQMIHEIYDDHHRMLPEKTGRSTDV